MDTEKLEQPQKTTKNLYRIGDLVLVLGEVCIEREYPSGERVVHRRALNESQQYRGLITGASVRREGTVEHYGEGETGFTVKRSHQVWLVRRATNGVERPVFEMDLTQPGLVPVSHRIPWRLSNPGMNERARKELRGYMQYWPRDKRGHWRRPPGGLGLFSEWLVHQGGEYTPLVEWYAPLKLRPYDLWALQVGLAGANRLDLLPLAHKAWRAWFDTEEGK